MKIAVAGGSGVLGQRVCQRLIAQGHEVRMLARHPTRIQPGVEAMAGNLLVPETLCAWLRRCDVAIHLATSLRPNKAAPADHRQNDVVWTEGTRNLLAASAKSGVFHIVMQSVSFVRAPARDSWCEGTEDLAALPLLASAAKMEQLAAGCPVPTTVLRGGLFYGPGTSVNSAWAHAHRRRIWHTPANARDYVSLVHVDDMADAVVKAALAAPIRQKVAIVDDQPVTWEELVMHLAARSGAAAPARGPASMLPSFRVSNARARKLLGWSPSYRSWRDGLDGNDWCDPSTQEPHPPVPAFW